MKGAVQTDRSRRKQVKQLERKRRQLKTTWVRDGVLTGEGQRSRLDLSERGGEGALNRVVNRCSETGRGRGVFRAFRRCRHKVRQRCLEGGAPGVAKRSW